MGAGTWLKDPGMWRRLPAELSWSSPLSLWCQGVHLNPTPAWWHEVEWSHMKPQWCAPTLSSEWSCPCGDLLSFLLSSMEKYFFLFHLSFPCGESLLLLMRHFRPSCLILLKCFYFDLLSSSCLSFHKLDTQRPTIPHSSEVPTLCTWTKSRRHPWIPHSLFWPPRRP